MANSPRMLWAFPGVDQDPWYDSFLDLTRGQDASAYAYREDRNLILAGGGTISFALNLLSWTEPISVWSPQTGFLVLVAAQPAGVPLVNSGDIVRWDQTRHPGENVTVQPEVATRALANDNSLVLCLRIDDRIVFRNGSWLGDGDTLPGLPGMPAGASGTTADVHGPKYIVGNALAGDTLDDCHYLDTGNGAAILSAINASISVPGDIWIRPGFYNFGLPLAPSLPMSVPAGTKIRGASLDSVLLIAPDSSDQGMFTMSSRSELGDLRIGVPPPTGPIGGSVYVVSIAAAASSALVRRVEVFFDGVWDATAVTNASLDRAFDLSGGGVFDDCVATAVPSATRLGVGGETLSGFYAPPTSVLSTPRAEFVRCFSSGGDYGFQIAGSCQAKAVDCVASNARLAQFIAQASRVDFSGCDAVVVDGGEGADGFVIDGQAVDAQFCRIDRCRAEHPGLQGRGFYVVAAGAFNASQTQIIGSSAKGWATGLRLDPTTGTIARTIVVANDLLNNTAPFTNLASGTVDGLNVVV